MGLIVFYVLMLSLIPSLVAIKIWRKMEPAIAKVKYNKGLEKAFGHKKAIAALVTAWK